MEIILTNIQSIKKAVYEFPDNGLVQLLGNNSNGKSILIKAIAAIATGKIFDNNERRALINDKSDSGMISLQYKGKVLIVKLHEDRNQCLVVLVRNTGERLNRTFRDGGIEELLYEFGFRTYNKNAVCLQVFETFGLMPFVNTTNRVNYEIVDSVTTDTMAQTFLSNFKNITREKAKDKLKQFDIKIESLTREKNNMIMFDYEAYRCIYNKMKRIYEVLKYLEPFELSYINIPPKVTMVDITTPILQEIKFVKPMPVIDVLANLTEELQKIKTIRNGNCPMCGKSLIDNHKEVCS